MVINQGHDDYDYGREQSAEDASKARRTTTTTDISEQHVCAARAGFQRQGAISDPEQHVRAKPAKRNQMQ